jgi:hypothetical protein
MVHPLLRTQHVCRFRQDDDGHADRVTRFCRDSYVSM